MLCSTGHTCEGYRAATRIAVYRTYEYMRQRTHCYCADLFTSRFQIRIRFQNERSRTVQCCYTPNVHKQNTAVIDEPHNTTAFQEDIIWLHLQGRISITGMLKRT